MSKEITQTEKKTDATIHMGISMVSEWALINICTIKLLLLEGKKKKHECYRVLFQWRTLCASFILAFAANDEWCCNLRADMRMKIAQVVNVSICYRYIFCASETENRLYKWYESMFKQQVVNTRFHLISSMLTQCCYPILPIILCSICYRSMFHLYQFALP